MFEPESYLLKYYQDNFLLKQVHNYPLVELEDMFPFEREIYISQLTDYIQKKKAQ